MTSVSSILCDVIDDVITDDVIRNFQKYFFEFSIQNLIVFWPFRIFNKL